MIHSSNWSQIRKFPKGRCSSDKFKCTHSKCLTKSLVRAPAIEQRVLSEKVTDNFIAGANQARNEDQNEHTLMMKSLISSNYQYFHNKVKVTNDSKPNRYQLKLPSKTGNTSYKVQYPKKKNKPSHEESGNAVLQPFKQNKISTTFLGKTTYQNDFENRSNGDQKNDARFRSTDSKLGKSNAYVYDDAPRFLQTQKKMDFLNWGGKNAAFSMKMEPRPAISNIPFQGKSMYKSQFNGKSCNPSQKHVTGCSFPKFSDVMMVKESHYSSDFKEKDKENMQRETFKPNLKLKQSQKFKGATQYSTEYKQNSNESYKIKERTVQQMQNLMLKI